MKALLIIVFILGILAAVILYDDMPKDYLDETVIPLQEQANTIQDAYDFAFARIESRRVKAMSPHMIDVYFTGDQVSAQRGVIEYHFTIDDGKNNYLADARVLVDMEANASTSLEFWYDPRTKGKITEERWQYVTEGELDISKWMLTLDEAFDIIYDKVGDGAFSRFDETKTVYLTCYSDEWIFFVKKERDPKIATESKHRISLNPITKEVIEIVGFEDNELP